MRLTTAEKRALEKHVGEMLNDFRAGRIGIAGGRQDRKLLRSAVDKLRASLGRK